jgi:hypothetical protein
VGDLFGFDLGPLPLALPAAQVLEVSPSRAGDLSLSGVLRVAAPPDPKDARALLVQAPGGRERRWSLGGAGGSLLTPPPEQLCALPRVLAGLRPLVQGFLLANGEPPRILLDAAGLRPPEAQP